MAVNTPTILALDFDGVICDGLLEYFETAWRTYCQIWLPPNTAPSEDLAFKFYELRPVIETGWEMPVLIRALLQGISEERIGEEWAAIAQQLLQQDRLAAADIGRKLDQVRDEWIHQDLDGWLGLHRFYPGVVERLQEVISSSIQIIIITTKEGASSSNCYSNKECSYQHSQFWGRSLLTEIPNP